MKRRRQFYSYIILAVTFIIFVSLQIVFLRQSDNEPSQTKTVSAQAPVAFAAPTAPPTDGSGVIQADSSGNIGVNVAPEISYSFKINGNTKINGILDMSTHDIINVSSLGLVGNIDLNNNLLLNVGNSATDFTTGGGLTLAGAFVTNGFITANNIFTLGDNGDVGSINTSDWDITSVGAVSGISSITFDSAASTLGAHTLSGAMNANNNLITNIGNAGTDFTSTGGLNLAGPLTASSISINTSPEATYSLNINGNTKINGFLNMFYNDILNVGFLRLAGNIDLEQNLLLNVGSLGTDFTSTGGLTLAGLLTVSGTQMSISGLTYTWPSIAGSNGQVLTNNGAGGLSWATPSAASNVWTRDSVGGFLYPTANPNVDEALIGGNTVATADIILNADGLETVFNGQGLNHDFRIRGDNTTHLLFVDASSDRVGINTNTPASKLHVAGGDFLVDNTYGYSLRDAAGNINGTLNYGSDNVLRLNNNLTPGGLEINNTGTNFYGINLKTNGSTQILITGGGLVSIGHANPQRKLHILSAGTPDTTISSAAQTVVDAGSAGSGGINILSNSLSYLHFEDSDGNNLKGSIEYDFGGLFNGAGMHFYTNGIGNPPKLSILDNGTIGIGNGSPNSSFKLDINGNLRVGGTIQITGGTPGVGKVLTSDASGNGTWQTASSNPTWTSTGILSLTSFGAFNGTYYSSDYAPANALNRSFSLPAGVPASAKEILVNFEGTVSATSLEVAGVQAPKFKIYTAEGSNEYAHYFRIPHDWGPDEFVHHGAWLPVTSNRSVNIQTVMFFGAQARSFTLGSTKMDIFGYR